MEKIPYPDNYFDPFGDGKNCPICDAVLSRDGSGELYCLQYHEEDLIPQKDYVKKGVCPVCSSNRVNVDDAELDDIPVQVIVPCDCMACKANWIEIYEFSRYEMIGTK